MQSGKIYLSLNYYPPFDAKIMIIEHISEESKRKQFVLKQTIIS
jgi:hypothetical protein